MRFPVVGIGASAGGLEAVARLLARLPVDTGMAFVVVQHLDPTRESLLPQILQKETVMPVAQAVDGVRIAPNSVYVIPPNTHMCVTGDNLKLTPRPAGVSALSVNCFLASLAEQRGADAIAVILSGTASDGALGVQAVKSEGGVVFAQDEETAGYAGMPHAAVETGAVDFVLPPERIAEELAAMSRRPPMSAGLAALLDDPATLARIFAQLRRETGVDFALYKPSTIKRRLMRRMSVHKVDDLRRYEKLLTEDTGEARALHDDLLIHVTHFFRDPGAHAALRARVLPRALKSLAADAPVRLWIPGCSTGEEAYSLAITVLDHLSESDAMNPLQIFATDISDAALEKARAGVYGEDIANFVPARLLRRFFTRVDRGYEIVKRVRDACVFARHDLTKDPPFANVDVISCCNVLIYLGPEIQKQILPMFHYALRPTGALILGSAETVGEFSGLFAAADKKSRLYYKKPAARSAYPTRTSRPYLVEPGAKGPPKPRPVSSESDVLKAAERLLLARFAPAGVIVGSDLDVLHFRGHVARFLEPATGRANLNLLKMLPTHAVSPVTALIKKARKSDAPASASGVELGGSDGPERRARVEAVPFRLPISGDRYVLVLFSEDEAPAPARRGVPPARSAPAPVRRLKEELASTRSYLQTVIEEHESVHEELKAANEEVVSSNEELQSTNEELEIAKEELQAANEELSTVNEELQTRNGDLGQLNNDLLNLITSVHLPIIMVSSDLRVRRFSPMAEKVMNLMPGDVGRLIGEIKPKFALPDIEEIIHDVVETVTTKELEVEDGEGRAYAVRIRPYKTTENKIDGAVLVFIDKETIPRGIAGLPPGAFDAALDIVREPLAVLDGALRVKAASRSMYQAHGLTTGSLGRPLHEIGAGRWNVEPLRGALEALAARGEAFTRLSAKIDGRDLFFSARRIEGPVDGPPLILLGVDDA